MFRRILGKIFLLIVALMEIMYAEIVIDICWRIAHQKGKSAVFPLYHTIAQKRWYSDLDYTPMFGNGELNFFKGSEWIYIVFAVFHYIALFNGVLLMCLVFKRWRSGLRLWYMLNLIVSLCGIYSCLTYMVLEGGSLKLVIFVFTSLIRCGMPIVVKRVIQDAPN